LIIKILKEAEDDIFQAGKWYAQRAESKLLIRLEESITKSIYQIENFPQIYQKKDHDLRFAPLNKFPFHFVYRMMDDHIQIIALAHYRRSPEFWLDRIIET